MRVRTCMTFVLSLPLLAQAPAAVDLKAFYQENCVRCHGVDGSAKDADGKQLKGQDLTDTVWASRTGDGVMVKAILKGKFFGMAMPAYKDKLSPEQAQALVTEVIRKAEKGKVIAPDKKP